MSLDSLGPKSSSEGGRAETPVEDDNVAALLTAILKELKILNMHMLVLSDNHFTDQDT